MKLLLLITLIFVLDLKSQSAAQPLLVHVALRIVDEEGHPVTQAMAGASAEIGRNDNAAPVFSEDRGFSDTNRVVRLRVRAADEISYGAEKTGYYTSSGIEDPVPT